MRRQIFQLKMTLRGVEPHVWRRVRVSGATTLARLHLVFQDIMGWDNKHLYRFEIAEQAYEAPDPEAEGLDAARTTLAGLRLAPGDRFLYRYDFGDDWEHEVLVEEPPGVAADEEYPICVDGENACPPEDCGGPPGYSDLLGALERPGDPAYREQLEWLPAGFNPRAFDVRATNRILALAHRRRSPSN